MSFDIIIATRNPPTRDMVESHVRASRWRLSLTGDLSPDSGIVAESAGLLRRKYVFNLSGPQPAENEDFPAPVQRLVRGSGYLLEMNLPWGLPERDIMRAYALCEHLAKACDGCVFDPQGDRIVFPDLPDRKAHRERVETPVRQLSLEWFFADSAPVNGSTFLATVQRVWPQAMPTRFGTYDPMRFKMADATGRTDFMIMWEDGRSFFWKSAKPVIGGSFFRSPGIAESPAMRRQVQLSVSLNATAIESHPAVCDRAVNLFLAVAQELGAFFGAGYVTRDVLLGNRGDVWYGPDTESIGFTRGPWWIGLPPTQTWLTWFGKPYRSLLPTDVEASGVAHADGLLVRLGPAPMDADQLRGLTLSLPTELVWSELPSDGRGSVTGSRGRLLPQDERSPAAFIPPFE